MQEKDALYAGRVPRARQEEDGLNLADLVGRLLTSKKRLLGARELSPRTLQDYYDCSERLVNHFGKGRLVDDLGSDDFEAYRAVLAKRYGPAGLGNEIQRIRVVLKYASDAGMIDKPMRYGPGFKRPSKKTLRIARHANGKRMFEPAQLKAMLGAAGVSLKAMILLGCNCGFGNNDVALLPLTALDLDAGWVNYPRPKTGINRRCPLWPETVAALREVIANRPRAKDDADAGLVFLTRHRGPWARAKFDE